VKQTELPDVDSPRLFPTKLATLDDEVVLEIERDETESVVVNLETGTIKKVDSSQLFYCVSGQKIILEQE